MSPKSLSRSSPPDANGELRQRLSQKVYLQVVVRWPIGVFSHITGMFTSAPDSRRALIQNLTLELACGLLLLYSQC